MPLDFIYCREYGLQPAIWNLNIGRSEARDNPLVLINQTAPKTLKWIGPIEYKPENEVIAINRVLYSKLIQLKSFNGYDNLYVGKKTGLEFQNIGFDFTNDRWKIRGFHGHPLNNTKFNVYDRPVVKSILGQFLSTRVDEVSSLMYTTIATVQGKRGFLSILEAVMEYGDEFFNLLKPYEVPFIDKYEAPEKNVKGNGNEDPGGEGETTDYTIYYVCGTLLALWLVKRKKQKNR